jgi:hypothetical protein
VRYILFLSLPFALAAQGAESDQRVTQALISETQQLRMAIERSTLLNARTQLALSQLQLQEQSVARIAQQLESFRMQAPGTAGHKTRLTEAVKDMEQQRTTTSDPKQQRELETQIKGMKFEMEQASAMETHRASRESDLTNELQRAQSQIAASRSRIDEMERALDAAIQQLLKK